jgi:addiction module HigA family antidote
MQMHDPAHPGEVIRAACLKPLELTVTAAAAALGVTRKAFSDLLNGHSGVSPDMAIRLEKVFGSTAEAWLKMQRQHDLWEARQRSHAIKVTKRYAGKMPAWAAGRSAPPCRSRGEDALFWANERMHRRCWSSRPGFCH